MTQLEIDDFYLAAYDHVYQTGVVGDAWQKLIHWKEQRNHFIGMKTILNEIFIIIYKNLEYHSRG